MKPEKKSEILIRSPGIEDPHSFSCILGTLHGLPYNFYSMGEREKMQYMAARWQVRKSSNLCQYCPSIYVTFCCDDLSIRLSVGYYLMGMDGSIVQWMLNFCENSSFNPSCME